MEIQKNEPREGQYSYTEITREIEVTVSPAFVPEKSNPHQNYFLFSYRVSIRNLSPTKVKLLNRHWLITDGNGRTEEVVGSGVIGVQPDIDAGQEFSYTSACPLHTPTGNMRGHYEIINSGGERFRVRIPLFFLRHPSTFH